MIKIALADSNADYLERLSSVLGGYSDLKISVYTDENKLELAVKEKNFDILLFDASLYSNGFEIKSSTLSVLLADEDQQIPEICNGFRKVKKYQRVSKIYQKILEYYADFAPEKGLGKEGKTIVTSYYSPAGGTGKTTVALASALRLSNMGKRVFYLNLENIPSDDFFLSQEGEGGLSQIAASLGDNINFSMKIQSMLLHKNENFGYLRHFDSPNDIYDLSEEEIEKLLSVLLKSALFDHIIVDMGCAVDKINMAVFEASDRIVVVEKNDNSSISKLNIFYKQFHIMNMYADKIIRIINFDNGMTQTADSEIAIVSKISAVMNPNAEQLVSMLSMDPSMSFTERNI